MPAAKAPATVKDPGKPARPAPDPAATTGRLATWVAKTTLDDVPASVRDRAKHLVLDGIGCALVGAQLPWSRIGVEGVTALDDAGDSVLVGWGGRATSATSAAMVNSSFIQGFELDDYHPLAPVPRHSAPWTCFPGVGIRARSSAPSPRPLPRERCTGWTPPGLKTPSGWRRP